MSSSSGRWLSLSPSRRLTCDLIALAQTMPRRTIERRMHLGPLVAAREVAGPPPRWLAIFVKAYAVVAARRPTLRQIYRPYPWSHLYEHPENVASVPIVRDEYSSLLATLRSPETLGLVEIDQTLRRSQDR